MNFFKSILIVVCLLPLWGQGQTLFNNYYKTGYNNVMSCMPITTADSGHVFVNYIRDSATHRQDFGLIKLDKNGNTLIKKSFNTFDYDYNGFLNGQKNFIEATASSYFLTGGINIGLDYGIIINKINRNTLDTIKSIVYGVNQFIGSYMNSFIKMNDNKYLLIGNNGDSNNSWPSILEIDSNLSIISAKNLPNPTGFGVNNAILNPVSKKILMAGPTPQPAGPSSKNKPITLMHTDTLGNILQAVVFSTPTYPNSLVQTFYSAFDNSYVLICAKQTGTFNTFGLERLCIVKVDANTLLPIWQKYYGDGMVITALADAVVESDGSIVACGAYAPSTPTPFTNEDFRGVIIKVDKDGNLIWFREYNNYVTGIDPNNYWESFYGIDKTKEGGYVVCGNVMNQPKAKAWAVKTNSLGCITGTCNNVAVTESTFAVMANTVSVATASNIMSVGQNNTNNNVLLVYPNPVDDILNIVTKGNYQSAELIIKNLNGQEIRNIEINKQTKIDVSDLTSGVYIIELRTSKNETYRTKFIKQ